MSALKLAFATDVVDPCDRFDLWHEVACKAYAEHECTTQSPGTFEGTIESAQLDTATLSVYENTPMHLWRTQRQVERAPSDRVFVCLQLDSTCHITQLGRETTIGPGEFCIIETKTPYVFSYAERSRQLVLDVARSELRQRLGSVSPLTALTVEADTGIGGLAAGYMRMLPEHAAALSPATGHQVANQVLDLVAMALARRAELGGVKLGSASAVTLIRLRAAIEQALPHRDAKCQDVAERAGISLRYANALLAKEGTSLERLLQRRRLENCRKALAAGPGRSISEIAYAWGFSDVSHFSKAFKNAFGVAPRDFRRARSEPRGRSERTLGRLNSAGSSLLGRGDAQCRFARHGNHPVASHEFRLIETFIGRRDQFLRGRILVLGQHGDAAADGEMGSGGGSLVRNSQPCNGVSRCLGNLSCTNQIGVGQDHRKFLAAVSRSLPARDGNLTGKIRIEETPVGEVGQSVVPR